MDVLQSFSIKNVFYDKMVFKAFLFSCDELESIRLISRRLK